MLHYSIRELYLYYDELERALPVLQRTGEKRLEHVANDVWLQGQDLLGRVWPRVVGPTEP